MARDVRAPATRTLAADLGVARATVLVAYEQLAAEGYLVGRQGSGSYVQRRPVAPPSPALRRPAAAPRLSPAGEQIVTARRLPLESAYAAARPTLRWDFRYGMPSMADFPLEAWRRCVGRSLRRAPVRAFDYGHAQGSPALRRAVADYLGRARGVGCTPEQIVIVTGSQQGLDLVAGLLLAPGEHAVVEEPAFEGARNAFRATGATVHAIPADAEGIDTTTLRRSVPTARLACVTPSHQFPLGGVLSWTRRAELLAWARVAGAWLIEDDYDGEFRYEGRPVAPLKVLDEDERVLYLGTFSKVMFPALRLGYLVVPPPLIDAVARAKVLADGGSARLEQEALAAFIAAGQFERHLRRARVRNGERRAALVQALAGHFGARAEVVGSNAGLHVVVWLRGVPGRTTRRVVERAAAEGVGVYAVTPHYEKAPSEVGLILGYAALPPREIRAGVARLAAAIG